MNYLVKIGLNAIRAFPAQGLGELLKIPELEKLAAQVSTLGRLEVCDVVSIQSSAPSASQLVPGIFFPKEGSRYDHLLAVPICTVVDHRLPMHEITLFLASY
ncbi:MAG: hypothetical protein WBL99_11520 [Candidatus Acidiferrales bacterium]